MSLLQDILSKMYVEPELLEQLDEEQKATLFIKMREEQVRRWKAGEEDADKEERVNPKPKKRKRNIQWLLGKDKDVWVWVMGDHPNDPTIEEIIELENQRQARQLAEREAGSITTKKEDQPTMDNSMNEDFLKEQLSQMAIVDHDKTNGQQEPSVSSSYTDYILNDSIGNFIDQNPPKLTRDVTPKPYSIFKREEENGFSPPKKTPPPIPNRPTFLQKKPEPIGQTVKTYIPGRDPTDQFGSSRTGPVPFPSVEETNSFPVTNRPNYNTYSSINGNGNDENIERVSFRSAADPDIELEKRQSEIFEQLMDKKQRQRKEAEAEEEARLRTFEEQERKSREVDAEIKQVVQKAREKYHQQLRTSDSIAPLLHDATVNTFQALCSKARPPKPANKEAIVKWYINSEYPKGTGLDPKTGSPARWFHGIISRADSEALLADKERGSFLVRVSEKIWGYTVSYVVGEGQTKHYLVESIPEGYQFLGTDQVVHRTLFDLIIYHETVPITAKGKEILKHAVGQHSRIPDYSELIDQYKTNGSNRVFDYYRPQF